jgi:hypothetical protein
MSYVIKIEDYGKYSKEMLEMNMEHSSDEIFCSRSLDTYTTFDKCKKFRTKAEALDNVTETWEIVLRSDKI